MGWYKNTKRSMLRNKNIKGYKLMPFFGFTVVQYTRFRNSVDAQKLPDVEQTLQCDFAQ